MTAAYPPDSWVSVLLVLLTLVSAFGLALSLLGRILAAPDRDVSAKVRFFPLPRIDIDAKSHQAAQRDPMSSNRFPGSCSSPAESVIRNGAAPGARMARCSDPRCW